MIENTSTRYALTHLVGSTGPDGVSGYITEMEAAGQSQLVHSDSMPADSPIAELEAMGLTFGPVDEQDPLFRPATLPEGWSKRATEHSMWTDVVDDRGRRRVAIFYKAAFYDRRTHAMLVPPTAVLSDLIRAGEAPASLPLDDLLTAEVARAYLTQEAEQVAGYLASWAAGDSEYLARAERIAALIALLPEEK